MPLDARNDLATLAQEAVIWGFPLVLAGRYLDAAVAAGVPFNRFSMNATMATPQARAVGPNIDTLNGWAWLDLSAGPQVMAVPDTSDRYYTIQLQDMYMNAFAYIGRRTTGTGAGHFAVTPPGFSGTLPAGLREIQAPTTKVLAFVRTLVRGPEDLAAVQAINGTFELGGVSEYPDALHASPVRVGALDAFQPGSRLTGRVLPHEAIAQSGAGYFDELDRLVRSFPPSAADAAQLARFAALGIGTAQTTARDPALVAELAAAVPLAIATAQTALKTSWDNGWSRRPNVVPFILDPLQRAANTIYGPGTQVAEESVFWNLRLGPDGEKLHGGKRYRLHFAQEELPPVDAFWSLALYDGNYFLFDNPLGRYGITDRSPGLVFGADGSLDIRIQSAPAETDTNWLPAPQDGFQLVFRSYQPRMAILDGSYKLPAIELVGNG